MKKLLLLHLLLAMFFGAQTVKADVVLNATNFPDPNFRTYISTLTGVSVGGMISNATLASVTWFSVSYKEISSLQGIEYFTELKELYCENNQLTSLDLSNNTNLYRLDCFNNQLSSLNVSNNTKLGLLDCRSNQLTSLDLSNNTNLGSLDCRFTQLTSLDVSNNTKLIYLSCSYNQLTSLDLSSNTNLSQFYCSSNQLTSLDLSNNTKLISLSCYDNQLTSLDVSKNTELTALYCGWNQLSRLDVSNNTKLENLSCSYNNIGTLYLSKNTELEYLDCSFNKIDQLNLSNNTKLTKLDCRNNRLTNLNLDDNTALINSNNVIVGSQSSTRRFQIMSNGSNVNDCWALIVGTTDASRIRNLKIDGVSKTPSFVPRNSDGWMIVSDDLKKIPLKVEYEFYTGNEVAGWMPVVVNYDVNLKSASNLNGNLNCSKELEHYAS